MLWCVPLAREWCGQRGKFGADGWCVQIDRSSLDGYLSSYRDFAGWSCPALLSSFINMPVFGSIWRFRTVRSGFLEFRTPQLHSVLRTFLLNTWYLQVLCCVCNVIACTGNKGQDGRLGPTPWLCFCSTWTSQVKGICQELFAVWWKLQYRQDQWFKPWWLWEIWERDNALWVSTL